VVVALVLAVHRRLPRGEELAVYLDSAVVFLMITAVILAMYGNDLASVGILAAIVTVAYPILHARGRSTCTKGEGRGRLSVLPARRGPNNWPVHHSMSSQSGGTSARTPDTGSAAVSASARRTADGMTAMRAARST